MKTYATLSCAVDDLTRRGFTEHFRVVGGTLRAGGSRAALRPEELVIREHHRFEGISDPDDMEVVYAIEGAGGVRGTLTDAYGVYSDPAVGVLLSTVPMRE